MFRTINYRSKNERSNIYTRDSWNFTSPFCTKPVAVVQQCYRKYLPHIITKLCSVIAVDVGYPQKAFCLPLYWFKGMNFKPITIHFTEVTRSSFLCSRVLWYRVMPYFWYFLFSAYIQFIVYLSDDVMWQIFSKNVCFSGKIIPHQAKRKRNLPIQVTSSNLKK